MESLQYGVVHITRETETVLLASFPGFPIMNNDLIELY